MKYKLPNGAYVTGSFSIDGISYPSNWCELASPEELSSRGIVAEPDDVYTPPPQTQFTSLEFLDRFTDAEQLSVVAATLANPQVKLWYDKMLAASYVDVLDPRTSAGIDALIAVGLVTSDRKAAILATS